ncbi:MAG: hypothetical protein KTR33_02260 [Gammaproteobacteria bacterium]|nr:hypothetical protein [Gammaproteobacteria bacterium]
MALPEVDSASAVRLNIRSKFNSSPFIHHHILRVDGARVGLYKESDRDTLLLTPGRHTLGLSCHSKNEVENTFDFNYRVSDGDATLDIDAEAGDSLCVSIGFELLNCAVFEIAQASYCN